jgi:hypothetical protein
MKMTNCCSWALTTFSFDSVAGEDLAGIQTKPNSFLAFDFQGTAFSIDLRCLVTLSRDKSPASCCSFVSILESVATAMCHPIAPFP